MEIDYREIADELEELSSMEGTELGEYWAGLAGLHNRATDCASDEFLVALEKEMLEQYNWIKENTKIVEVEETRNVKYRSLEFL